MSKRRNYLTAEKVRDLLDYDPETGIFRWKRSVNLAFNSIGRQAGCIVRGKGQGYRAIKIGGVMYKAGRLAWLYVHGKWPENEIDHINCDRSDDRLANLREATSAQNKANRRMPRNNKCGYKGVRLKWKRWSASIWMNGRSIHLGTFDTPEEAHAAYVSAAKSARGEYARAA